MSILTPHNKSRTAGPQSSPSHMEALRRIRQAYQRQLEQMQITWHQGVWFSDGDFLRSQIPGRSRSLAAFTCMFGQRRDQKAERRGNNGGAGIIKLYGKWLVIFPCDVRVVGSHHPDMDVRAVPNAKSGAGIACVRWHADGLSACLLWAISQAGQKERG